MVGSINNTQANQLASLNVTAPAAGTPVSSFADQLTSSIASALNQSGNGPVQVQVQQSSSDASQFTITIEKPAAAATTPASTTVTGDSLMDAHYAITSPAAATAAADTAATDKSQMTPDDAYWAEQPPAVQALRTMPADQKGAAAQDLANQGYTIDVPIMVWGWDPLATMVVRQNDGLTWVPSALQPNIPVAPGDTFPGEPSYDPANAPAGSIAVNTNFAIGTNGQDSWIPNFQTSAS